jgi:choline dehydrogenase
MSADCDYVIVGSGAGGGPLAANLARRGYRVILLEAGGDSCTASERGRLLYEVPIFHGLSTEHADCQWDYYVHHYVDQAREALDPKAVAGKGVWYPRAGTLGGCTAHNAMITVTPQDGDWDHVARLTGDDSWRAERMNAYFARMEDCRYVPRPGSPAHVVKGLLWSLYALLRGRSDWKDWTHGHGFEGWLTTSQADPKLVFDDRELVRLLAKAVKLAFREGLENPWLSAVTRLDPNDLRNGIDLRQGLALTPLAVRDGKRIGPRELLLRTQQETGRLHLELHALVTRVLFEGSTAVGVEYVEGPHLYEADPAAGEKLTAPLPKPRRIYAAREVILAAGAFNSPQLLKLSGVGPRRELEALGIDVVVDRPGVGENLQDRYEVGVISEFPKKFALLEGATFAPPQAGVAPDPYFVQWTSGKGVYASNGALLGILKRSHASRKEPDLYIFGLPGYFAGYKPGYSALFERQGVHFTWAILKAYTNNTAGSVTLRSADPRRAPCVDFRYFEEGNDSQGSDLDAVVHGVQFVRRLNERLLSAREIHPGPSYDTPEQLRTFVRNEAWGHHASCTNRIGPEGDAGAVLDSRFRVRGTERLRVVDASVFPRIPGYFIVSAVYMISEKASDVVAEDAEDLPSLAAHRGSSHGPDQAPAPEGAADAGAGRCGSASEPAPAG